MSKEINYRHSATGLASGTLYFTIRANPDQMWNTSGTPNFETINPAHWANYAIPLAEDVSGSYLYVGTFPAISGNMVAGWYWIEIYLESSPGTPAISDTVKSQFYGFWNGTSFQPGASVDGIATRLLVNPNNKLSTTDSGQVTTSNPYVVQPITISQTTTEIRT